MNGVSASLEGRFFAFPKMKVIFDSTFQRFLFLNTAFSSTNAYVVVWGPVVWIPGIPL